MNDLIVILMSHTHSVAQNSRTFFAKENQKKKMCILNGLGEYSVAKFSVESITIAHKVLDSNGIVEIGKSYIRFCVSLDKSSTPIQVKIDGQHIQTACFNNWNSRGNIVLFIDADVARTTFSALKLSERVDSPVLAYWK